MLSPATGRVLVPQHPDLIYDFLPISWLKVGNAGVSYRGLTYDGDALDELRLLRPGTFRAGDPRVPFLHDPRDRSRLWHRHHATGRIHELVWREAHLTDAPLTDVVVQGALDLVAQRGGNNAVSKRTVMLELIDALTELTSTPATEDWKARNTAARMRHEQARKDHADVVKARAEVERAASEGVAQLPVGSGAAASRRIADADYDTAWPDYDEQAV